MYYIPNTKCQGYVRFYYHFAWICVNAQLFHVLRIPLSPATGNGNGGVLHVLLCQLVPEAVGKGDFPYGTSTNDWEGTFLVPIHRRCASNWQGSIQDLEKFMMTLNQNNLDIKLTFKYGLDNIDFLGVSLNTGDDSFVSSNLYRKTTATNTLFSHPKALIYNISVGRYLRVKRICSKEKYFEKRASEITLSLQKERIPGPLHRQSISTSKTIAMEGLNERLQQKRE